MTILTKQSLHYKYTLTTEMGDCVQVQFPVPDTYFGI